MNKKTNEKDSNIIYHEWVSISIFFIIMITLLLLGIIALTVVNIVYKIDDLRLTLFLGIGFFLLFLLIGLNFRGMKITITPEIIKLRYGLFNRKEIAISAISKCEKIRASFKTYWGFGVRVGFDGSLAYTTDFKEAIRLTYQNNKRFVFSTRNPHEIIDLLTDLNEVIIVE
jgi:hypothetical protein